jgi:hypothetical protein
MQSSLFLYNYATNLSCLSNTGKSISIKIQGHLEFWNSLLSMNHSKVQILQIVRKLNKLAFDQIENSHMLVNQVLFFCLFFQKKNSSGF